MRCGDRDLSTDSDDLAVQIRKVSKVVTHPKYIFGQSYYDAAILTLDRPLELNAAINTICLPKRHRSMLMSTGQI